MMNFIAQVALTLGVLLIINTDHYVISLLLIGYGLAELISRNTDWFETKCPECHVVENQKVNIEVTFADQVYRDIQRIDRHYYPDGKESGTTVRWEQARVPVVKYTKITTCAHCDYEYSRSNEELEGSPNGDINEMFHRYKFLKPPTNES